MKFAVLVAVVLGLAFSGGTFGDAPPLAEVQRIRLEEAFHLVERLGQRVWPEFEADGAPVLLIAGKTEYVLNQERAPRGFSAVAGDRFRNRPVFARPAERSPQLLATFPIDGISTVVIGTAEQTDRSPTTWVLTVAHELFHVFQAGRGMNAKIAALEIGPPEDPMWHLEFPFPYEDPDVQRAMHLLGYNLYRTARPGADDPSSIAYDARTSYEALGNLFLLLDLRYNDDRNANYLRYQTAKEGVARYFEYRIAEEAAGSGYRPLESFARSEGFVPYREVWEDRYASELNQIKHAGRVSRSRLEFYSLGLGLALTLDRLDADWKSRYFEAEVWVDDLLHDAAAPESAQICRPRD